MKRKSYDLIGERFGRLVVIGKAEKRGHLAYWLCRCDCGRTKEVQQGNMIAANTRGCGCKGSSPVEFYSSENAQKRYTQAKRQRRHVTHGMTNSRLYQTWTGMRGRCFNETDSCYHCYGGRGIIICPEWGAFECFRDWAYANGYSAKLTIDRIDNDGNYEPRNCRWITRAENARYTRRTILTVPKVKQIRKRYAKGERQCDIARHFGVTSGCVNSVVHNRSWRDI